MGLPLVFSKARGVFGRGTPYPPIPVSLCLGNGYLSHLINKVAEGNFLSSCKIGGGEEEEEERRRRR